MSNEQLKGVIEQFWDTIPPVWGRVRNYTRGNATRDFGLTLIQFHVLRHIRNGYQTVGELADRQQISRPAISLVVDQLVKKGLVSRTEDEKDRRYTFLKLTTEGESLLSQVFGKSRTWMAEEMGGLNPGQLETLTDAMTILKNIFDPAEEPSS